MGRSCAHAASGARFFFFFFSGAKRKDFRRGRSKSLHGSAVILTLVSPGGIVSPGSHGTLSGVSERVFDAERGRKVDAHFRRWSSELLLLSPRKGGDRTEKDRGSLCAGCRGSQPPVSPKKVSSVFSPPSLQTAAGC